jgi:hypothetical protein
MGSAALLGFLPILFLMKEIDFNDTSNLLLLRITFTIVQALLVSCLLVILYRIRSGKEQSQLLVPKQQKLGEEAPASGEMDLTTVEEYDMQQLRQLSLKVLTGLGISTFIHVKWGIVPPLFMQFVANPVLMYNAQLCKIHLFGQPAQRELQRPWKEEKPFEAFFGKPAATATTTKKEEKRRVKEEKKRKKP